MATIKGKWKLYSVTYWDWTGTQSVSFVSNGVSYTSMMGRKEDSGDTYVLYYGNTRVCYDSTWENAKYQIVDFGEAPQTVTDGFLNQLKSNSRGLIKGKWKLGSANWLDLPSAIDSYRVKFATCDGREYNSFSATWTGPDSDDEYTASITYCSAHYETIEAYSARWGAGGGFKLGLDVIDFGEADQEISPNAFLLVTSGTRVHTFDLMSLSLSENQYRVKVAALADGYSKTDSANIVIYTPPATGTVILNRWGTWGNSWPYTSYGDYYIKFGSEPTNLTTDYDYKLASGASSITDKSGSTISEGYAIEKSAGTVFYAWSTTQTTASEHHGYFYQSNSDPTFLDTTAQAFTIEAGIRYYFYGAYDLTCLTGDTLITMSDGTERRIDTIKVGEKVLSYNPETGNLEEDEVTYSDSNMNKQHDNFDVWTFDDGTIIKTIHRHRFYNVERNAMVYMDEWKIGEHGRRKDGAIVKLISHQNIKETVKHYTIFTKNQNYFANGLLSGNRHTKQIKFKD